jgi:predicted nuclease of restriction endonuclease-like (RecB) superfamily
MTLLELNEQRYKEELLAGSSQVSAKKKPKSGGESTSKPRAKRGKKRQPTGSRDWSLKMAKKKPQATMPKKRTSKPAPARSLLGDLRQLIEAAREQTARAVNSTLVTMYWQIGKRIRADVLQNERAEYGKEILQTLSEKLTEEYGNGFTRSSLSRMMSFAEGFPDERIVAALSQQLSWSHFVELIPLEDSLKRDFYAELCRVERWSVRTLRHKIGHLLYERTAVSRKPEVLIAKDIAALRDEDRLTPDMVFRDPYFLDFLGLSGQHAEHDLEDAILRELEAFILEMGTDFAFVARQKRMAVDSEDYYLDLLFYRKRPTNPFPASLVSLVAGVFQSPNFFPTQVMVRSEQWWRRLPAELSSQGGRYWSVVRWRVFTCRRFTEGRSGSRITHIHRGLIGQRP